MTDVQAAAQRILVAGHRSRIRCAVGLGVGILIALLGLGGGEPGIFWWGVVVFAIAAIMFARANGKIRQADLEVAKARQGL